MSWHFLQGQEAESWEGDSLDGAPPALLNLMPTPAACCCNGKRMDCSNDSRYGTTCAPSTAAHGGGGSMLSAADSHAPTSAQPGKAQASTERPAAFGWKWPGSFAKWDRSSCSWRTRQCSLLGGLDVYSEIWPRWGLMQDGECLEQTALGLRMNGRGFGLWPTPRANDGEKRGNFDTKNPRNGLPAAVKRYMTPTASIGTKCGGRHNGKADTLASQIAELEGMEQTSTGQLNPTWVEWLMGWPIGWTACAALETDKYQEWQRLHGGF